MSSKFTIVIISRNSYFGGLSIRSILAIWTTKAQRALRNMDSHPFLCEHCAFVVYSLASMLLMDMSFRPLPILPPVLYGLTHPLLFVIR